MQRLYLCCRKECQIYLDFKFKFSVLPFSGLTRKACQTQLGNTQSLLGFTASVPLTGILRGLDAKISNSSVRFRTIKLCTTQSTTLLVVSELAEVSVPCSPESVCGVFNYLRHSPLPWVRELTVQKGKYSGMQSEYQEKQGRITLESPTRTLRSGLRTAALYVSSTIHGLHLVFYQMKIFLSLQKITKLPSNHTGVWVYGFSK